MKASLNLYVVDLKWNWS